ncbi:MAG: hypothetical protein H6R40_420 [Gemmatimonadetes bacterium]|nr:hypothetical protein [Gemmatimonadota bacterium]
MRPPRVFPVRHCQAGGFWGFFATSVTDTILLTVFVNERPVRVPPAGDALAAVRALDPALADTVAAGRGYLTDGRGIRVALDMPMAAGAILRAVVSARQPRETDDHA